MASTKFVQIERELRARMVDGVVPRGTTMKVAAKFGVSRTRIINIMDATLIRTQGGHPKEVYEPPLELLVDRGHCLELEAGPAARYDIIRRFNAYCRHNKIRIPGEVVAFDREFKRYLDKFGYTQDWAAANQL